MHIKEQIKTKPFIVPSIYDSPTPITINNNPLVTVTTLLAEPAAYTAAINSCSLSVPENCLGIVVL